MSSGDDLSQCDSISQDSEGKFTIAPFSFSSAPSYPQHSKEENRSEGPSGRRGGIFYPSSRPIAVGQGGGDVPPEALRKSAGTEANVRPSADPFLDRLNRVAGTFGLKLVKEKKTGWVAKKLENDDPVHVRFKIHPQEQKHLGVLSKEHPHLVTITPLVREELTVVIQDLPSLSLKEYMDQAYPICAPESFAKDVIARVVNGLQFFEFQNMVHQNLELSTVLVFWRPFNVKVSGFEKVFKIGDPTDFPAISRETDDPIERKYIPPELTTDDVSFDPERIDPSKIDPYRLGVFMYRVVMGRFHKENLHPGKHVTVDLWKNEVKEISFDFQKLVRLTMLASPGKRLGVSGVKYSDWLSTKSKCKIRPAIQN